ncbi:MAG: hypothetical protein CMN28_08725 [Salinisphaeraceae bacterium]|jgi:outer membrane immunogenic protein|nr:hypothetical protein [Salinisphaeraceae bacterium]
MTIRSKSLCAGFAVLSLSATAALAQGEPEKARASTAKNTATQWTGWHVGAQAGVGFSTGDDGELEFRRVDGSDNTAAINNAFGDNFDGEFDAGYLVGVRGGYDWRAGDWVYGVLADFSDIELTQDQTAFSATPATYIERRELKNLGTLRGRLGWAGHNTIMPYVSGGLAYGDVQYSWEGNSGAFRGDNGQDGGWTAGYTVGAGVEVIINPEWSFGVEYAYTNMGDEDFQTRFDGGPNDPLGQSGATMAFGSPASGGTVAEGTDDDFDFQTISFNLIYRPGE